MKLKIIIKVEIACYKCRTKALTIAASAPGVVSVTAQGDDHLVVTGWCVDPVELTATLRKKVGVAILISVEEVKDPKKEQKAEKEDTADKKNDKKKKKGNKNGNGNGNDNGNGNGKGKGKGKAKEKEVEKEKPSSPPPTLPQCCSYGYGMPPQCGPCGPCGPPYYNYPQPQYCMYEFPTHDSNPPCSIM